MSDPGWRPAAVVREAQERVRELEAEVERMTAEHNDIDSDCAICANIALRAEVERLRDMVTRLQQKDSEYEKIVLANIKLRAEIERLRA